MFDRFIVVDWSAQSTPKLGADSIWIAVEDATGARSWNPRTRAEAEVILDELVNRSTADRTLIGVDFSLGYPAGTAAALGVDVSMPWRSTWDLLIDLIVDESNNRNNRFEVASLLNERMSGGARPFWGCPPSARSINLASTKPTGVGPVPEWRSVEATLRIQGRRPFSSWQLLGAGAVGSQTLLGVPMVARVVERLGQRAAIWPFTTGLSAPLCVAGSVVIAEVWPSILEIPDHRGRVRDEAQVETTAAWLAGCARDGTLPAMFSPTLDAGGARMVVNEEGWVLGVV